MSLFLAGKILVLHVSIYSILKLITMQKLSPEAKKKKAARDLAYAKTPDRRAKKADDQRRHRKDPSGKGKDWDHKNHRWETTKQNRGNDGIGTKKEKGKKYKIG